MSLITFIYMWAGFALQSFHSRSPTEVDSLRSCQKLPLCPAKPLPASSKTELMLAKPISDGESNSGVIYFKKVKKPCSAAAGERRICESTSPEPPKPVQKDVFRHQS